MGRFTRALATPAIALAMMSVAAAPHADANTLKINGQAQQQDNWCWAATGDSIANYFGKNVSQNVFCDLAFDLNTKSRCPDNQATLGNDQEAFSQLGINAGDTTGVLDADTVNNEISDGRPINTRIEWNSGGGHMMAIYGFDANNGNLNYYDPWPDDNRYNTASYDWYTSNDQFSWTDSLYGIGAN